MTAGTDRPSSGRRLAAACSVALLLLAAAGCSRAFYRRQADGEVGELVDCGSQRVCSTAGRFTIQPSPASRMFDPNNPDCPPMPPDDPTSHQLMHCVDCKHGWPHWDRCGFTPFVENPAWRAYLPCNEQGQLALDRDAAVEIALLQSREYQKELEDLYLSALGVTFQRFRFDAQFFGDNSTFYTADGPDRMGGLGSQLRTDTGLQMSKLLAGGGQLLVGVANSLVWQFAGPDGYGANTLADFSIIQPLLRAGGRAVVMERLTDAERALLANIRQMERFRRAFYVQIVAGRNAGAGPDPGGIGIIVPPGAALRGTGGYLGLLEEQVRIRNLQGNVAGLRESLDRLIAFNEVGRISTYDVGLTRQRLYREQGALIQQNANYQTTLDAFKVTLGLPPELDVKIESSLLDRFDLIDPTLTSTQEDVARFLDLVRNPQEAGKIDPQVDYPQQLGSIRRKVIAQLEAVREDLKRLDESLPTRRENLRRLVTREEFRRGDIDPQIVSVEELGRRVGVLHEAYATLAEGIGDVLDGLEPLAQDVPHDPAALDVLRGKLKGLIAGRMIDDRFAAGLSSQLMELALIQAGARLDTITLSPVELDAEEAVETARTCRRDWMNARAALVDVWRQIEVTANDLQSNLDVTFSGDINTLDNNPVRFRGTTGRLRVGLEFDAPLTRLVERNTYREALIDYQQARRGYYEFEDRVYQGLRDTIRTIRLNQLDFEVQRAAVFVAIARVDEAQMTLEQPPKPGEAGQQLRPNTARDLVDALASLLRAQNDFLGVWVNQEAQRLSLDLDLGTMQLDARGLWTDPGPIESGLGDPAGVYELDQPELIPLPEGLPLQELLEEAAVEP